MSRRNESIRYVGIDISAKTLEVSIDESGSVSYANTMSGHRELLRKLTKSTYSVRVCVEATGIYGVDLCLMLEKHPRVEVMVANPRAVKAFGQARMGRSKTDRLDAIVLASYAEKMPFRVWQAPQAEYLHLRTYTRRIQQLTRLKTQEKNRLHAQESCQALAILTQQIKGHIEQLDHEIAVLRKTAVTLVKHDPSLKGAYERLLSTPGISIKSALAILGEWAILPKDMDVRQLTAMAGLDPSHKQSGTSVHKRSHISKQGNRYLRAALYMPALTAIRFDPHLKRFYEHLLAKGKPKMVAIGAVMRKLLHAFFGMMKHQSLYDGAKLVRV